MNMFTALFGITILSALAGVTVGVGIGWVLRGRATVRKGTIAVCMEKLRAVPLSEHTHG